jgi:hypothetical protein
MAPEIFGVFVTVPHSAPFGRDLRVFHLNLNGQSF